MKKKRNDKKYKDYCYLFFLLIKIKNSPHPDIALLFISLHLQVKRPAKRTTKLKLTGGLSGAVRDVVRDVVRDAVGDAV